MKKKGGGRKIFKYWGRLMENLWSTMGVEEGEVWSKLLGHLLMFANWQLSKLDSYPLTETWR